MKSIKIYLDDGNILTIFDSDEEVDYKDLCKNVMNSKNIVQLTTDYAVTTLRPSKVASILVEDVEENFSDSTSDEDEDIITDGE